MKKSSCLDITCKIIDHTGDDWIQQQSHILGSSLCGRYGLRRRIGERCKWSGLQVTIGYTTKASRPGFCYRSPRPPTALLRPLIQVRSLLFISCAVCWICLFQVVERLLRLLLVGRTLHWRWMGRRSLFLKVFWVIPSIGWSFGFLKKNKVPRWSRLARRQEWIYPGMLVISWNFLTLVLTLLG